MRTFDLSKQNGSSSSTFFNKNVGNSHFGKDTSTFFGPIQTKTIISDDNPQTETLCSKCQEEESKTIATDNTVTQTQVADATAATTNHCSPTSASFTTIPSGNLTPTFNGNRFSAPFDMIGSYNVNIPCACSCGEYRQFVRGFFKINGTKLTHNLCSNQLEENVLHEDCATVGGTNYMYGYRNIQFGNSYFDRPDQANGCRFNGHDDPGLSGFSSGDVLEMDLFFVGFLVDKCNNGGTLAAASWTVKGSGTAP